MQVIIDKFGRMVLPKTIRDDLGLEPGSALEVEERQEEIILKPIHPEQAIREKESLLVFSGKPTAALEEAVDRQRRERLDEFHPGSRS
ncbi:MAG: AbrB/MazE/SpoVT family DNA-binding domain-containing protein [Gemmatimonadetes bacterium]|jgi:AbrB family looped-hinge helix DNA binding protein|nr:AbrB/MazE/SpoVT family DNA-binding domain-containing protein [Gemmatimonadota bacterium]